MVVLLVVLMVLISCKIQNLKLVTNFFKVNHLFSSITDFNRSLLGFSWGGGGVAGAPDGVDGLQVIPYFFCFHLFFISYLSIFSGSEFNNSDISTSD